jgi:predicted transcriptional regulator
VPNRHDRLTAEMSELGARRREWVKEGIAIKAAIPDAARRAMRKRGVSAQTVAEALGVTRQTVHNALAADTQKWVADFKRTVGAEPIGGRE